MNGALLQYGDHPLVILSATDTYAVQTLLIQRGVPFERVVGCYKGKMESSFVVLPETVDAVIQAGHLDDQECVLYLEKPHDVGAFTPHTRRHAWLMYTSLAPEQYLGLFQGVYAPAPHEDYTYAHKTYYVVRENVQRQKVKRWAAEFASKVFGRIKEMSKPVPAGI